MLKKDQKTAPCTEIADEEPNEAVAINEVQLILAEKRTSLAVMRTGITLLAIPLSVYSLLIATSRYYDLFRVLPLFTAVMILCGLLVILGLYLIIRSVLKLRNYDRMIRCIKARHSFITKYVD